MSPDNNIIQSRFIYTFSLSFSSSFFFFFFRAMLSGSPAACIVACLYSCVCVCADERPRYIFFTKRGRKTTGEGKLRDGCIDQAGRRQAGPALPACTSSMSSSRSIDASLLGTRNDYRYSALKGSTAPTQIKYIEGKGEKKNNTTSIPIRDSGGKGGLTAIKFMYINQKERERESFLPQHLLGIHKRDISKESNNNNCFLSLTSMWLCQDS